MTIITSSAPKKPLPQVVPANYASLMPNLTKGKNLNKNWIIEDQLGEGGCGVVFAVNSVDADGFTCPDTGKKHTRAAAKVQLTELARRGPLPMELAVIKAVQGHPNMPELIESGRLSDYQYIVMGLLGPNLAQVKSMCKHHHFARCTAVRLAIQITSALEHLHSKHYVHRDIKPANFSIGHSGASVRTCFMLDFGLARKFMDVNPVTGEAKHKKQRPQTAFRGTVRYSSAHVLSGGDASRRDDLISMIYTLVELYGGRLPWTGMRDRTEVVRLKNYDSPEIFERTHSQIRTIYKYAVKLDYAAQPSYKEIMSLLQQIMTERGYKMESPYDWEEGGSSYQHTLVEKEKDVKEQEDEKDIGKKNEDEDSVDSSKRGTNGSTRSEPNR